MPLRPNREFSSDDFPTFERPDMAISARAPGGHSSAVPALNTKPTDSIFTLVPSALR